MDEFSLIRDFLAELPDPVRPLAGALAESGDDCAVFLPSAGMEIAISTDQYCEGVHFPTGCPARMLGARCLAAALSDLAAVGANPLGFTLALCAPHLCGSWMRELAQGCGEIMTAYGLHAMGGDLIRGRELYVSVTVLGEVPKGKALARRGAEPHDLIFVSGTLGDAAIGLALLRSGAQIPAYPPEQDDVLYPLWRYYHPEPRIALGRVLLGIAHCAIDISDGLLADLRHILAASGYGAHIEPTTLPKSGALVGCSENERNQAMLTGGDDYELCFTVPPARAAELECRCSSLNHPVTRIGVVEEAPGLRFSRGFEAPGTGGYNHFPDHG